MIYKMSNNHAMCSFIIVWSKLYFIKNYKNPLEGKLINAH